MIDLTQWQERLENLKSTTPEVRARAVAELREAGPSAIVELTYEVDRCYRMLRAFDGILKSDKKLDDKVRLKRVADELEKRMALIDKSRCSDCLHLWSLHLENQDGATSCVVVIDLSSTASDATRFCRCKYKKGMLHAA